MGEFFTAGIECDVCGAQVINPDADLGALRLLAVSSFGWLVEPGRVVCTACR